MFVMSEYSEVVCLLLNKPAFTFLVVFVTIFAGNDAIGNGFGGDSGWIFVDTGTTSVGEDTCFVIVAGCFSCDVILFSINYVFVFRKYICISSI